MQLDSACLSSERGVLALSCLWLFSHFVLGLKFTFFLSSLSDLESSSDCHFAYSGIDTTAVSLILNKREAFVLFLLLHLCVLVVSLWVSFSLCQPFLFLLGESRGNISSSEIMCESGRSWISNSMLSRGLMCLSHLDCFGPPFPHLENGTDNYLMGLCLEAHIFLLVVLANDNVAALPERRGCGWMFWVSVSFAKHAWC